MAYKTYSEMISEHLGFLRDNGLVVDALEIDAGFVRCRPLGCDKGRGELCYKTTKTKMDNGLMGLATWCRGTGGSVTFRSYGLDGSDAEIVASATLPAPLQVATFTKGHEEAARKAYGFWKNSQLSGTSDYLIRKGIGSYGLRFRQSEQYGNVAIVPMFDEHGKLWNRQLLNPDGSKFMVKGGRTAGLFHKLAEPVNGRPIGIAEGYVTAATCMELSGIPTVCAFSSDNLVAVTKAISLLLPASPIIMFADNDKHLEEKGMPNKGVLMALEARKISLDMILVVKPNFVDCGPSKEASDWNDLVRLKGREFAKAQIQDATGAVLLAN